MLQSFDAMHISSHTERKQTERWVSCDVMGTICTDDYPFFSFSSESCFSLSVPYCKINTKKKLTIILYGYSHENYVYNAGYLQLEWISKSWLLLVFGNTKIYFHSGLLLKSWTKKEQIAGLFH
jgi:hypothetical protein